MGSPFVYLPGERLGVAELSAARLDGHLVDVGEGYMPADAIETAEVRAASLAPLLGDTLAATHLSAAWVYGAIDDPPFPHSVQRAVERRLHHVRHIRFRYRDTLLDAADIRHVVRAAVSTPERTLADLARSGERGHRDAALALLAAFPGLADRTLAWFDRAPRMPGSREARSWLRSVRRR